MSSDVFKDGYGPEQGAEDFKSLNEKFSLQIDALGLGDKRVTILHGDADATIPFEDSKRLQAVLPQTSELRRFGGDDHWLSHSRPEVYRQLSDMFAYA